MGGPARRPVGKGDSDIDHVVIGPGGVFTINTKNHSGQKVWVAGRIFLVNGQKQPHLRNAGHEAQRASRLLSAAAGFRVDVVPGDRRGGSSEPHHASVT